jgi:glycosyltransferase involved in cell wall biosynthesis
MESARKSGQHQIDTKKYSNRLVHEHHGTPEGKMLDGVNKDILESLKAELAENKSKKHNINALMNDSLPFSVSIPFPHKHPEQWLSQQKRRLRSLIKHIFRKQPTLLDNTSGSTAHIRSCVIAIPNLYTSDAVSNDALMQAQALRDAGVNTVIFAKTYAKEHDGEICSKERCLKLLEDPTTLLIYNHCVYWPEGDEYIAQARGQVWFRFHNVTPARFFEPYDSISTFSTQKGIEQTAEVIHRLDAKITRYLPVSPYNAQDLLKLGVAPEKLTVLAPFHRLKDFESIPLDQTLETKLKDGKINLLFVGRLVPHKGLEQLISTLQKYVQFYGNNVRLILVGTSSESLKDYYEQLFSRIHQHKLSDLILWVGQAHFQKLHTYYACAHAFLLFSKHEGFCLPIIEAQAHRVPVVAVDTTAISETMGPKQLCFSDFDPDLIATALHKIVEDKTFREDLIQAGLQNLQNYTLEHLNKTLIQLVRSKDERTDASTAALDNTSPQEKFGTYLSPT